MSRALRRGSILACLVGTLGCASSPPLTSMLEEQGALAQAPADAARARTDVTTTRATPDQFYASELRQAWAAYAAGDYERAMLGYERVAGRAEEPRIQVRALICLAMIRLLPSSKMHDEVAGGVVLDEIERRIAASGLRYEFFGELELLQLVVKQDEELVAERAKGERLRKDLAARDAVIKKLRALSVETQ